MGLLCDMMGIIGAAIARLLCAEHYMFLQRMCLLVLPILSAVQFGCGTCSRPSLDTLAAVKSHDLVFRGRVLRVGEPPGYFSGLFLAYQVVDYQVLEVYKGSPGGDQVSIFHVIIGNGSSERRTPPGLDPAGVSKGRELLIFAQGEVGGGRFMVYGDDPLGVTPVGK